jgi:predicted transcriptional regulator
MTARSWDEDQLAILIALRERGGLTHPQIAERMGATKRQVDQQVYKLILGGGVAPRAGLVERDRTWDDVREQLKPLYEASELDHDEMAARLKLSKSQLQSQLNRMFRQRQLTPRKRGPRPRLTRPASTTGVTRRSP